MIRTALTFIQKELETFILDKIQNDDYLPGTVVELNSIISSDGTVRTDAKSHIDIMLVRVNEEKREGLHPYYLPTSDKKNYQQVKPPVEVELTLLFIANNTNYETSLRDLTMVLSFFQSNSVFDGQLFPNLNASVLDPDKKSWQVIDKLIFRMINYSLEQQNNLWAMIGAKYMPSLLYTVSLLSIFNQERDRLIRPIVEQNIKDS